MKKLINKILEELKRYDEVLSVILFGSYAKDNPKPISDIDICVILNNPDENIEAEIGSMYSSKIDLVLFHRLPLHIQFEVFKYGKILYFKNEEKLSEIKIKVLREYLEMSKFYEKIKQGVLSENY